MTRQGDNRSLSAQIRTVGLGHFVHTMCVLNAAWRGEYAGSVCIPEVQLTLLPSVMYPGCADTFCCWAVTCHLQSSYPSRIPPLSVATLGVRSVAIVWSFVPIVARKAVVLHGAWV